jgi:hypothetical protein
MRVLSFAQQISTDATPIERGRNASFLDIWLPNSAGGALVKLA